MSIPAAYATIIIVWATTPLAIKISSAGISIYDAATLRIVGATALALLLTRMLRVPLPWRGALRSYAAGAFGVYAGLLPVYYAAQFIPSGVISVIYGLAPVISGLMAVLWLGEREFSTGKFAALLLALGGLALVFRSDLSFGSGSAEGLMAALASVILFTYSSLLVKRLNAPVHPLAQATGTLVLSLPLYLLTWWSKDGSVPASLNMSSALATAYLALFSSVLSFVLYFYILRRLPLSSVALTTLVSPVIALFLGIGIAGEQVPASALAGSVLILCALASYQLDGKLGRWLTLRS